MKNLVELLFKPTNYLNNLNKKTLTDIKIAKYFLIYFLPVFYLLYLTTSHIFNIYSCISWFETVIFFIFSLICGFLYSILTEKTLNYIIKKQQDNQSIKETPELYCILLIFYPGILIVLGIFIILISFFININLSIILSILLFITLLGCLIVLNKNIIKSLNYFKDLKCKFLLIIVATILIFLNPLVLMSYLPVRYEIIDFRLVSRTDMNPILSSKNIVIIDKISGFIKRPTYNDIVLVKNPTISKKFQIPFLFLTKFVRINDLYYLRRIVGKSGDSIKINSQSEVILNNNILDEPYVKKDKNNLICLLADYCSLGKIKHNNYYVLGDNRNVSQDSRIWSDIGRQDLKGKLYAIIWPKKDYKFFH